MADATEPAATQTASSAPAAFDADTAKADLRAWFDRHCRDNPVSRDTGAFNAIHNSVVAIEAALSIVQE